MNGMEDEKILSIVRGAVRIALKYEGYSEEQIKTAINYSYADIEDFVKREVQYERMQEL